MSTRLCFKHMRPGTLVRSHSDAKRKPNFDRSLACLETMTFTFQQTPGGKSIPGYQSSTPSGERRHFSIKRRETAGRSDQSLYKLCHILFEKVIAKLTIINVVLFSIYGNPAVAKACRQRSLPNMVTLENLRAPSYAL